MAVTFIKLTVFRLWKGCNKKKKKNRLALSRPKSQETNFPQAEAPKNRHGKIQLSEKADTKRWGVKVT